jgi:hypothetical protein
VTPLAVALAGAAVATRADAAERAAIVINTTVSQ